MGLAIKLMPTPHQIDALRHQFSDKTGVFPPFPSLFQKSYCVGCFGGIENESRGEAGGLGKTTGILSESSGGSGW